MIQDTKHFLLWLCKKYLSLLWADWYIRHKRAILFKDDVKNAFNCLMKDSCYSGGFYCCWGHELAYSHVAWRAGRLDVPQGLHEGGVHIDVAIGEGEVLQERSMLYRALDRRVETASNEVGEGKIENTEIQQYCTKGGTYPSVGIWRKD